MREIKFRGFSTDGKWVYGDLIKGECFYISTEENFYNAVVTLSGRMCTKVEIVDKDSLGEFTGLLDNNGKEIYEGDIVEWFGGVQHYGHWEHHVKEEIKDIREIGFNLAGVYEQIYVIGNIYENPELLEV